MYEILFSKKSVTFIKSLDKGYKNKIKEIIKRLQFNPFIYPYKKIKGGENLYRIRAGKYRILYEINKEKRKIIILKIDKRSKIYK